MISEIGQGKKYKKAQDADPTTTICGMPVMRNGDLRPQAAGDGRPLSGDLMGSSQLQLVCHVPEV
jgi:hypothetical protein